MSTLDRMRINLEGIGHALSDKKLQVPVYQRAYAWQEEHVTELFQDIGEAISDSAPEYFVGSIVVSSKGIDRPEVVDGQQRLATTTILLSAIRDYFFNTDDIDRAVDLEKKYLKERDLRTQEEAPRFRLNKIDDDFFRKRVWGGDRHFKRTLQAPRRRPSPREVGGVPRAARQEKGAGRKAAADAVQQCVEILIQRGSG